MTHIQQEHSDILTAQKCQRLQNRTGGRRTYRVRSGRKVTSCFQGAAEQKYFDIHLLDDNSGEEGGDPTLCIGQSLDIFRRTVIRSYIREYFNKHGSLRFKIILYVTMARQFRDTDEDQKAAYLHSTMLVLNSMRDFNRLFNRHSEMIHKEFQTYTMNGSGWMIRDVTGALVKVAAYKPLSGGGGGARPIRLQVPEAIRNSACVVNPPGDRGECFKYAILCAAFHQDMKANGWSGTKRSAYTTYLDKLDFTGINYPVAHTDVATFDRFEKNNPGYSLNIMMVQTKKIHSSYGLRRATRGKKSKGFNIHTTRMSPVIRDPGRFPLYLLLLYNIDHGPKPLAHYTAVTKLSVFWEHARPTVAFNKSVSCFACQTRFAGRSGQRRYNAHFQYCEQGLTAYNHRNLARTAGYRNLVDDNDKKSICLNCHTCYVGGSQANREKYLSEHTKACAAHPPAFVKMPSDPVLAFDKYKNQRPKPFRIYSVRIHLLLLLLLLLLLPYRIQNLSWLVL